MGAGDSPADQRLMAEMNAVKVAYGAHGLPTAHASGGSNGGKRDLHEVSWSMLLL